MQVTDWIQLAGVLVALGVGIASILQGLFVAPGQSILVTTFKFPDEWHTMNFHIEYSDGLKAYKDDFALRVDRTPQYSRIRPDTSKDSLGIIAEAVEEICEKIL